MQKISNLKVQNPSCLWGQVVQGPGGDAVTTENYNDLMTKMNLFYHDVTQDLNRLKPTLLEGGQVYVVYWAAMKSWCRAVVESLIMDSVPYQAHCLLVDHGEQLVVPCDQIRVAMKNFLQLPFWVRRFHLAGIKPTTLRVSVHEKAKLIPSGQWDSSATLYLHNLLQTSTRTEVVLLESESDSTAIELYLTIDNIMLCVNDDLVVKKFAYYSREFPDSDGRDEWDQLPVMLSSNILTQTDSKQTPPLPVKSQSPAAAGTGDWLTALSQPQGQQLVTSKGDSRSKDAEEQLSPWSQSRNSSDTDTAAVERLTPSCQSEPVTPDEEAFPHTSQKSGSEDPLETSQVKYQADEETSRSAESGTAEGVELWRSEEDWACARLLEWLNPEPLNPDPGTADNVVSPIDPRHSEILVHSAVPVEPCNSLNDAPITEALCRVLRRKECSILSAADRYSWPSVARGCNTVIVSHNADQPMSYLTPLLTHILLNTIFTTLTSGSGPIAVLLCRGWEQVQVVYDLLEEIKAAQILHPVTLLLGIGKDEPKTVKIPKNCLLLVTTPFTLVRLLSCHCFLFLRLSHLVLDEADKLFTLASDQMETILQHFQKVTSSEERQYCPQQLVAVAKRWTGHMEGLLVNHMPYPCVVITVPEEAALYSNVQQIILMTLESSKISVLLGALDFNPDTGQKTVIVANSVQEVEDVFKAVSNKSAFCLKTHEGSTHQFDFVVQQWRKDIGPGTHVILVTSNKCLKCLDIRDATCVVHYGFPTSPKVFGSRLFCMAKNFRNLSGRVCPQDSKESCCPVTRSVLLISESNARHVVGILRYLKRTNATLPPELLSFAQGVHVAREDQKTNTPLCSYLKSFGVCRDSSVCPDRHRFNSQLDQSELPASEVIEVVPLYIKTASVFYGRIVSKDKGDFDIMAAEMTSYYADKNPGAKELLEGGLYAVQDDKVFHRVKILSVPDRGDRLFFSVSVQFIDVGKEEEVKSHQILQLPEEFHSLPNQAMEIVVCRVKPVDAETDWHPKVTRAINQKIQGLQHRAKVVLSLGNTVFVDPMVRVTRVPGMKTVINEYSVQSEILNTGMGVSNPEHLDLLTAVCQEGLTGSGKDTVHTFWPGNGSPSLEVRIKAEEEVLAEAFRVAEVSKHGAPDPSPLNPREPLSPISSTNQSLVQAAPAPEVHLVTVCSQKSQLDSQADNGQRNTHPADIHSAEQMERNRCGKELCPTTGPAARLNSCEKGVPQSPDHSNRQQPISANGTDCHDSVKSFHPQVRWYQTADSVIVTMMLMNPDNQRCDFYLDRVVYSGRVNGQSYRADLELHQNIAADCCCWEMKSNEPVLKLIKQQKGYWERLLRNKNIFVSYDMEHFDEDEDRAPTGPWFVENTGEDDCYVNAESSSESD